MLDQEPVGALAARAVVAHAHQDPAAMQLLTMQGGYARGGEDNDLLDEDKSVASGRAMAQIAEGKGRAPKPFMLAKGAKGRAENKADAVWQSNPTEAREARTVRPAPRRALKRQGARLDQEVCVDRQGSRCAAGCDDRR